MTPVDKVFILAYPGANEKKKTMLRERLRSIPLAGHAPLEVIEITGSEHVSDALAKHGLQMQQRWSSLGYEPMEWREISLAIGHWNVWTTALDKYESILVLEEGFLAESKHYHVLDTAEAWEMIYLGRFSSECDTPCNVGGMVRPGYSNGSFAYIVNRSGIRKLLRSGYHQNVIPVGEFLSAMHGAHPVREVLSLFSERIATLAPMKNFITIDTLWNNTEDIPPETDGHKPLHSGLFKPGRQWTEKYLNLQLARKEFDLICDEPIDNVYTFPLFTPLFCKEIIEEAEHFGKWSSYRGKNDPPIDIMLSSFGFNDIYSSVLKEFLYPLFYHKYQLQGEAWKKLNSQNFMVRYLSEQQGHLGLHNDGSYLSLIVTLNTDYEGGGTFFPKFKTLIKPPLPGYASVHPGLIGYLHGARPITKGRRYILTSFFFLGSQHPFAEGAY